MQRQYSRTKRAGKDGKKPNVVMIVVVISIIAGGTIAVAVGVYYASSTGAIDLPGGTAAYVTPAPSEENDFTGMTNLVLTVHGNPYDWWNIALNQTLVTQVIKLSVYLTGYKLVPNSMLPFDPGNNVVVVQHGWIGGGDECVYAWRSIDGWYMMFSPEPFSQDQVDFLLTLAR